MSPSIIHKPKVEIDPAILAMIKEMLSEESQVIVHCIISAPWFSEIGIRIWPTTYLFDTAGPHKSELVHFENITPYPEWKYVPAGSSSFFTLFFSGLPSDCTSFDLIEQIPESFGFQILGIDRNESDIYYVRF